MKTGADWYKREPTAFLGGIQGMSAKEIAVYSVVLDLIYQHGGSVNDDPGWFAGWVSDMGSAAVRRTISGLIEKGKLIREGDQLTNKTAKTSAKTKENLTENARKNGQKGGKKSAEIRARNKENSDLSEPPASTETQADKIREDKIEEVSKATSSNARDARAAADHFSRFWEAHPKPIDEQATQADFDALVEAGEDPSRIVASAQAYAEHVAGFSEAGRVQQSNNFLNPERGMWRQYVPRATPPPASEQDKLGYWVTQIEAGCGYGLEHQMAQKLVALGLVTKDQLSQAKGYNG